MRRVFKRLSAELQGKKLSDTNYQFVGYGGAQDKPHSYTVDRQLTLSKKVRQCVSCIHSNQWYVVKHASNTIMFLIYFPQYLQRTLKRVSQQSTVSSSGDALAAISYASQLPFRSGAKPIIILISCDECSQSSQVRILCCIPNKITLLIMEFKVVQIN